MGATQLDRIEEKLDNFMERVNERAIDMESRVAKLETNQKNAGWLATWLSGIIASIVTAVILSFDKLFGSR